MERRNIAAVARLVRDKVLTLTQAFKLREEDFHKEWAMKKQELESKVQEKWKAFEEKKEGRILVVLLCSRSHDDLTQGFRGCYVEKVLPLHQVLAFSSRLFFP